MLTTADVQWSGGTAHWAVYRNLYEVDKAAELRIVPKLTPKQINPNPFQRMKCSYALQVFSKSSSIGIKAYREIENHPLFKGTESTEKFTTALNDLFDACNGRIPSEGLRPNCEKFMIISKFLEAISPSDTFATDQTIVSLQVTLTSVLALTKYLCEEIGYNYALAGKYNQDLLEKFFGLVRSFGGDDSHPTAASFSHIFRLLSVYFPTSRSIKGNVKTDEDYAIVSSSCMDSFKDLRNKAITARDKSADVLEEKILERIFFSKEDMKSSSLKEVAVEDHGYSTPPISRCIVYNFCGFLAYKGKTFTKCEACIDSLLNRNPCTLEMQLTKLKDLGRLKYPSKPLFELVHNVLEPALHLKLESSDGAYDFVSQFLESLNPINTYGIGCSEAHSFSVVVNLIKYYVTIRLWFHVKQKNGEVLKAGTKRQANSKLSKL